MKVEIQYRYADTYEMPQEDPVEALEMIRQHNFLPDRSERKTLLSDYHVRIDNGAGTEWWHYEWDDDLKKFEWRRIKK